MYNVSHRFVLKSVILRKNTYFILHPYNFLTICCIRKNLFQNLFWKKINSIILILNYFKFEHLSTFKEIMKSEIISFQVYGCNQDSILDTPTSKHLQLVNRWDLCHIDKLSFGMNYLTGHKLSFHFHHAICNSVDKPPSTNTWFQWRLGSTNHEICIFRQTHRWV